MAGTSAQSQQLINESIDAVDFKLQAINKAVRMIESQPQTNVSLTILDPCKPRARISGIQSS